MKLLADEGIDRQIVDRLRVEGHDVTYIAEFQRGDSDQEVLSIARTEERVLLTQDKDFGELVFRQGLAAHGVLLIRLAGKEPGEKATLVATAIEGYGERLELAFAVLSAKTLRIRHNPAS